MSSPEFVVSVASAFASKDGLGVKSCGECLYPGSSEDAPEDRTCSRGGIGAIWLNGGVVTCFVADTTTTCDRFWAQLKDPVKSSSKTGSVRELTKGMLLSSACMEVSRRSVFRVMSKGQLDEISIPSHAPARGGPNLWVDGRKPINSFLSTIVEKPASGKGFGALLFRDEGPVHL
jgi:hypothetical protein